MHPARMLGQRRQRVRCCARAKPSASSARPRSPTMIFKARTLVALAFAALAATVSPSVALAAHHHHHVDRASYPMKADEFRQLMEKRIDRTRAAIDRKLD